MPTLKTIFAGLQSLSGRLVLLAIAYVLVAQFIIYVPTIALYRYDWLQQRAESALLAALAREATLEYSERLAERDIEDILYLTQIEGEVSEDIKGRILDTAGIQAVAVRQNSIRQLILQGPPGMRIDATINLADDDFFTLVIDAWTTMFGDGSRLLNVLDKPDENGFAVEYTVSEAPLRAAMLRQSSTIWIVAGIISVFSGLLLFLTVFRLLVRPMHRITGNMIAFRAAPEDAERILVQRHYVGELGEAERALSELQYDVRASLKQKTRLAALGEAVSKINHDLRNMLTTAQLLTDRIALSEDPAVQKAAPRLVSAIDRAVNLSTNVLKYGREEAADPSRANIDLNAIVWDVDAGLDLHDNTDVDFTNAVPPGMVIYADAEHIFRILMNLTRNAVNALHAKDDGPKRVTISARAGDTAWELRVTDTGTGLPQPVKDSLFQAFVTSSTGGTGLGLSIAAELTRAHGGEITLARSDETGTEFLITIPFPDAANGA